MCCDVGLCKVIICGILLKARTLTIPPSHMLTTLAILLWKHVLPQRVTYMTEIVEVGMQGYETKWFFSRDPKIIAQKILRDKTIHFKVYRFKIGKLTYYINGRILTENEVVANPVYHERGVVSNMRIHHLSGIIDCGEHLFPLQPDGAHRMVKI